MMEEQNVDLVLPNQDDEDKMLKEVMKMSALEYQKENGQIDLSHLKRKPNKQMKKDEIDLALRDSKESLSDE